MAISSELTDALKRCLRAQAMTYRDLAGRLGVSEAAVKRMFSLRAMSLQRLEQICAVLDIGLAELSAEAGRTRPAMAQLGLEQEQALVDDPRLLLAMFLTLNRWRSRTRWHTSTSMKPNGRHCWPGSTGSGSSNCNRATGPAC
ncbi:helix-turn-helix domain-containing protein [Alkalisalibacterium limincola]|uniref:Helix-turn-helix transcriptional regulator n=1 Tax=Alkalisalibacterium limincola TaxID=2699169 RepID=A0A5C8KY59_9GAMM|nr:helix-turn-helix transcriptional regulator [Alkalisalibacterium limincola]TXK65756.1 helix-turn-helix transcriptional regulator [Alkalisalibacterium limincola]